MSPSILVSHTAGRTRSQLLIVVAHAHSAAGAGSQQLGVGLEYASTSALDYCWSIESEDGTRRVEIVQQGVQTGSKVVQVVFDLSLDRVSFEQIEGGLYFAKPIGWMQAPLRWITGDKTNGNEQGAEGQSNCKLRLGLVVTESDGVFERDVPTRVRRLVEVDDLSAAPSSAVTVEEDLLSGAPMHIDPLAASTQNNPMIDRDSNAGVTHEPAALSMQEHKQVQPQEEMKQPLPVESKTEDAPVSLPRIPAESPHHHSTSICDEDVLHASSEPVELIQGGLDRLSEPQANASAECLDPELSHLIHSMLPRPLLREKLDLDSPASPAPSMGRVLAGVALVSMLAPAGSILLGVMARNMLA